MSGIHMPGLSNEMLHFLSKYLNGHENCLSLSLSGVIEGFGTFYGSSREMAISPRSYFLTPSLWNEFFTQFISPELITNFSANSCYWLPGEQITDQILKMRNVEELAISDTKVSLPQLARVLDSCHNITKLDFSYHHLPRMDNNNNQFATSSVKEAFKKLTSLKISTAVLDAVDYKNDPWLFIIKMLSWCSICTDLAIKITYTGRGSESPHFSFLTLPTLPFENEVDRVVRQDLLPLTDWMKSLQSLVLIKLGLFTSENSYYQASSLLLDHLLYKLFSSEPSPSSLVHLWIKDFSYSMEPILTIAPSLKTFHGDCFELFITDGAYERFRDLEQFGGFDFYAPQLAHLPNVKTACGHFIEDGIDGVGNGDQGQLVNFIRRHPNLEQLSVNFRTDESTAQFYVPNAVWQLPKLKRFFCGCFQVTKDMVDEFVRFYPNIESLYLGSTIDENDHLIRSDPECLDAIQFPRLTSLGLEEFNLLDGSFLPKIISISPKLERIYLDGVISEFTSFVLNLDIFLEKARNLRDFRLDLRFYSRDIADALGILKSLSVNAPKLERISIEMECDTLPTDWSFPLADFIVQLALKLKRLTCLSLSFYELNDNKLIEQVHRRMAEEVLPNRPALWFHLGSDFPEASDPSVPAVHYNEMICSDEI